MSSLKGETIIYFGPEPWAGLWRNRHQLMSRLARDNNVWYIEPATNIRNVLKLKSSRLFSRDITGVSVFHSPWWLPITGRSPFKDWTIRLYLWVIGRLSGSSASCRPIVWFSRPAMLEYLGKIKARRTVYHVVDEYSGYGHPSRMKQRGPDPKEVKMLGAVDTVIVVTPTLFESKSPHNADTHIVPNAVDFDAYANCDLPVPGDIAGIDGPIVGYSGLIAARLDLELLTHAARTRPDWNFVFVGDVNDKHCESELQTLAALSNVHLLGNKNVNEVPAYLARFDVCVIPYVVNLRAQHASPLKLFEYAAASKPIVTTDFAAARAFEGHVRIAASADDFIAACREAIKLDKSAQQVVENRKIASHNTWSHRVNQVSEIFVRRRILYVARFATGGSIESLLCLIGGLDKALFDATVLFHSTPEPSVRQRVKAAGASVEVLFADRTEISADGRFKKRDLQSKVRKMFGRRMERMYASAKFAAQYFRFDRPIFNALRDRINELSPDLVHFNNGLVGDTPGILAARNCRVTTICHARTLARPTHLSLIASRWARNVLCISSAVREVLIESGVDADKCIVIPNAVDPNRFNHSANPEVNLRSEFGWSSEHKVYALVGRVVSWKGQNILIEAMAIARQSDSSVRALIVGDGDKSGANDAYIARLRSRIEELGLEEIVILAGHRSDIPAIMKEADVVVCPSSLPEPFGRVIIESMAVGTPIIATNAGGATDIITDNVDGLLVAINDSNALSEAILRLSKDQALARRLSSAALRTVAERYTVNRHAEDVCAIYSRVLEP